MPYMSTRLTYKISTSSEEETKSLAAKIGRQLRGGEVIILGGDLGFGKTVFMKGLVGGAGIKEEVTSPSFTISNLYSGNRLNVYHMDYYRIHEAGLLKDELLELLSDKKNVIAIEWSNVVSDVLPESAIRIKFTNLGENYRQLIFNYQPEHQYLFEGLRA